MAEILVVEDEEHIASGLCFNLELEGHRVTWLKDGLAARRCLFDDQARFDLVILDLMLPGMSGLDLCRGLRRQGDVTPVLMLTARQYAKDKVAGLQMGADDYVTKPFHLEELLARIDGLLRRARWAAKAPAEAPGEVMAFRDVVINFATCEARVGDRPVKLTPLELEIMRSFNASGGRVLSREELLHAAWETDAPIATRTVDNFILRLRKHFEHDPAQPAHILSVRGKGYRFVP